MKCLRHKLPMLNWSALNPNQLKGTVFNELNDEKLVDVSEFLVMIWWLIELHVYLVLCHDSLKR